MVNIFVYGSVGIAGGALPNRRAPNLARISCLSDIYKKRQQTEYLETNRLQILIWRSI